MNSKRSSRSKRVVMRDVQSYCGILLDDNNSKPICRLYFNSAKKAIGLFDNAERKEERVAIDGNDAIHDVAERLRATAAMYDKGTNRRSRRRFLSFVFSNGIEHQPGAYDGSALGFRIGGVGVGSRARIRTSI